MMEIPARLGFRAYIADIGWKFEYNQHYEMRKKDVACEALQLTVARG
jgi:hypothetical protein